VQWRVLNGPGKGHIADEKEYRALEVADNVCAVSYLAASGFTLTVVLNFETGRMFGFASGAEFWAPASGTFEFVP
jgi:hypothetical protein